MCNLPPKFHSVCRLCLSFCGDNCSDVKLPIFDRDKDKSRLSDMIMTYLSIMVIMFVLFYVPTTRKGPFSRVKV